MFSAEMPDLPPYVTCGSGLWKQTDGSDSKNTVTLGGNQSTGTHEKGREALRDSSPPPQPPPPHHPRIRGSIRGSGRGLDVCFWRGGLINSHERGPSIQPASRDALHWAGLLSSPPVHKTLSGGEKKKKKKKGVDSLWMWAGPNDAIRFGCPLWLKKKKKKKGFRGVWSDLTGAGGGCPQNPF